ncbi:hypothetical protein CPB86DRAFT_660446, partial [Serendipita vermifera]
SMLPPEVYQIILRYSISVPNFLDPDAVDRIPAWAIHQSKWNNQTEYWAAERTRNSLRRVCKSWDHYLHRYGHRFVRI